MTKIARRIFPILSGLLLTSPTLAQGPPINTDSPILLGLSGAGVRSFAKVTRKSMPGKDLTVFMSPVALPYNLTTEFLVGAILPYFSKELNTGSASSTSSGIGDVKLFAKYLLLQIDRPQETFRVMVKGTVKLPTGEEDEAPSLGTGTTDYGFGAVAGWVKPRVGFYVESLYSINTSRDGLDYGDVFGYNLAVGYRFYPDIYRTYPSPQLNAYFELNRLTTGQNQFNAKRVEDSGGTTIFLSPGLQYVGGRKWLIEGSFLYPLIDEPNGKQLQTDFSASLGVRILLF